MILSKGSKFGCRRFHWYLGGFGAGMLGYSPGLGGSLPGRVVESFAGMGNPWFFGSEHASKWVSDVLSGSGIDCSITSRSVISENRVTATIPEPSPNHSKG